MPYIPTLKLIKALNIKSRFASTIINGIEVAKKEPPNKPWKTQ